jgi:hypothetical protein
MTYDELLEKVKADHATAEQVNAAGGIREEVTQSDKLGYDWHIYYVNDIAVRKDYVEQETPYGTADNPIVWKEGMSLIPNAYYTHDGVRKVWVGDEGAIAAWDDDNFVEF